MDAMILNEAQLSDDLRGALAQLAALTGQSKSAITEEALREYLGWRIEQLLDLREAVAAADRGEFATDDEVKAFFKRHGA